MLVPVLSGARLAPLTSWLNDASTAGSATLHPDGATGTPDAAFIHHCETRPMSLHKGSDEKRNLAVTPFVAADTTGGMVTAPPRHRLPESPMPSAVAYQLV